MKIVMQKKSDILIIDDEQVIIDAVIKICSIENYSVDSAGNVKTAIEKLSKHYYSIIICDIMMPDGDGFQIIDFLTDQKIDSTVIMTTGYSTVENAVKSLYKGAVDFIPKPFTVDELLNSVYRGRRYNEIRKKQEEIPLNKSSDRLLYVPCPAKYFRLGYSSWLSLKRDGSVMIGVCDLFVKTIDTIKEIEFQSREDEIAQGICCATILSGEERSHKILAPASGRIIDINESLSQNPNMIEKDPYFDGWIYHVIPVDLEYEQKNLTPCSSDRL